MYSIITIVFLLYNLLFLFLSYYCYKIHKYVTVLNNRITNYNAMSLLVNNVDLKGQREACGGRDGCGDSGGRDGRDGCGSCGSCGGGRDGRGDSGGRDGGGCGSCGSCGGGRGNNYKSMLISIINNANIDDNEFKVLIELYIQVIKSCKSIYAKFINIYTKKIEDM
jgi:hypothetical protein